MKFKRRPTIYDIENRIYFPYRRRLHPDRALLEELAVFLFAIYFLAIPLGAFAFYCLSIFLIGIMYFVFHSSILALFIILVVGLLLSGLSFGQFSQITSTFNSRVGDLTKQINNSIRIQRLYFRVLRLYNRNSSRDILTSINTEISFLQARQAFLKSLSYVCGIVFFTLLLLSLLLIYSAIVNISYGDLIDLSKDFLPELANKFIGSLNNSSLLVDLFLSSIAFSLSYGLTQSYAMRLGVLDTLKSFVENDI